MSALPHGHNVERTRMNHRMPPTLRRRTFQRFIRFGLVGGSGVLVDMGVLFFFSDPRTLSWGLSVSKTLAAEAAIANNFIWNDIWTFQDLSAGNTGWGARASRFAKFNLVCLAGIGINVLLLTLQVHSLRVNVYLANLVAIFVVSIWNFSMNLRFGWGEAGSK
jgi:dolichol-phosphate mannosyltransferase